MLLQDSVEMAVDAAFRRDVLRGFRQEHRAIPARWFYDRRGSELFEAITKLPEYYPTRIETAIFARHAQDIARLIGPGRTVVEFGAGSATKTPLILTAIAPSAYVPIDISGAFLRASAARLGAQFPELAIHPVEANFMEELSLPDGVAGLPKLGFFPGSTIGNLVADSAVDLLRQMRRSLGVGSMLLIGVDRIKDVDTLRRAYDDPNGVTAAFNLNLLARINRELKGTIPIDEFSHVASWNENHARIEMHLTVARDVQFSIDGEIFAMVAGETIHTENSHKYGARDARLLLRAGGWSPVAEWTDEEDQFAVILAEARPQKHAP